MHLLARTDTENPIFICLIYLILVKVSMLFLFAVIKNVLNISLILMMYLFHGRMPCRSLNGRFLLTIYLNARACPQTN